MKWIKAFVLAVVLVAIGAAGARAQMPAYDTRGYCAAVAGVGGTFSEEIMQSCLRSEQTAYDAVADAWSSLPEQVRAYCDGVASVGGGGSFEILQSCVRSELRATAANRQFHFRRAPELVEPTAPASRSASASVPHNDGPNAVSLCPPPHQMTRDGCR